MGAAALDAKPLLLPEAFVFFLWSVQATKSAASQGALTSFKVVISETKPRFDWEIRDPDPTRGGGTLGLATGKHNGQWWQKQNTKEQQNSRSETQMP